LPAARRTSRPRPRGYDVPPAIRRPPRRRRLAWTSATGSAARRPDARIEAAARRNRDRSQRGARPRVVRGSVRAPRVERAQPRERLEVLEEGLGDGGELVAPAEQVQVGHELAANAAHRLVVLVDDAAHLEVGEVTKE